VWGGGGGYFYRLAIRAGDGDVQRVVGRLPDLPVGAVHVRHGDPGVVAVGGAYLHHGDGRLAPRLLYEQPQPPSWPVVVICRTQPSAWVGLNGSSGCITKGAAR